MMKRNLLAAALAAAAAHGLGAAPAGAAQIDVSIQDPLVNSGNITDLGTYTTSVQLHSRYGDFYYTITASDPTGNDFVSDFGAASTIIHPPVNESLTMYVTEVGITASGLQELFNSSFFEGPLQPGSTTTLSTSLSQQFVTPSQLALATYSGQGATVTSVNEGVSGVYSVTEKYVFSPRGVNGDASPTIEVARAAAATPVPEPSTWAMLGMGFGGLAFAGMVRRGRKESRFAL